MREGDAIDPSGTGKEPLLPGELSDSEHRDDAEHWVAVYQELIGFLVGYETPTSTVERFRWRLTFWRRRSEQLRERSADRQ
jgi:hypothetical protein